MTPETKFALNRYAADVVRTIEGTLDLSPYMPEDERGRLEARLWFWETMAKAVAAAHERVYLATLDRP